LGWAVVIVTVIRDDIPVEGIEVAFSRSVSGLPTNYKWKGKTDKNGQTEIKIVADSGQFFQTDASGYYRAQAVDPASDKVVGQWGSIPINDSQVMGLTLGVGQKARVIPVTIEDDIREAVFRYQFEHNASEQQQSAKAYFLSLSNDLLPGSPMPGPIPAKGRDPDDAFVKRFQGHKPPVKKISQSTISPFEGVKDRETGEEGLIFWVTHIRWKKDTEVEVDGGYYEGGRSSSINLYRVVREGDRWVVKEDRLIAIS
jgi:hypothetical protein